MFGLEMRELIVVFAIVFLIFGTGRLPQVGRSLGEGIREFKKALTETAVEAEPETKAGKTGRTRRLKGRTDRV